MKYLYSKEQIDKAIKRIKRFRRCKVYLSDHFNNGLSTVIEVCGLSDDYRDKDDSKRIEKINKILSEELDKDAHLEYCDWMCQVCYVGEDDQVQKGSKYDPVILDGKDLSVYPNPLLFKIQNLWKEMALSRGDQGTCVMGEHMEFVYEEKHYILEPLDYLQGSLGREMFVNEIKQLLKAIGCQKIYFDYGRMD